MLLAAPEKTLIVPYSDLALDPERFGADPGGVVAAIVAGIGKQHELGNMYPIKPDDVRARLGWVALDPEELGTQTLGYVSLTAPNGDIPSRVSSLWATPGHGVGKQLIATATEHAVRNLGVTPDAICRIIKSASVFQAVGYRLFGRTDDNKFHMVFEAL
ncbi:hypothetical protein JNM87_02995 [Candidatus Saccharibacteria bacterium]|nr:hypothetical protein [Candidatus Saccharibacteria bacterium]